MALGNGRRAFVLFSLGAVLALSVPSAATTIPLPKGVVVGKHTVINRCNDSYCVYSRVFGSTQFSGRLRGLQVVGSATYMLYDSFQYFCPLCLPTTPQLARPFTIKGRTASGAAFNATCTSGVIEAAIEEAGGTVLQLVRNVCDGGTSSSSGLFAFDFLLPIEDTQDLASTTPYVGFLVEVRP